MTGVTPHAVAGEAERPSGRDGARDGARGPFRVLVLCTGNSARSQIAEALLTTWGAARAAGDAARRPVLAASAGSRPAARVHPLAVAVLGAHGILWEGRTPRGIDDVAAALGPGDHFNLVVTVCDDAREACPYFPGAAAQVHWGLPDPAAVTPAPAALMAFEATYDALAARVDALLALPLEHLDPAALRVHTQAVHDRLIPAPAPGRA